MERSKEMDELAERSGNVEGNCLLAEFLYDLMRDYVPVGVIEKIIVSNKLSGGKKLYCNGFLATYAKDVANRLLEKETPHADSKKEEGQQEEEEGATRPTG